MSENGQTVEQGAGGDCEEEVVEHDPQYDPIISLPEVNVPTLEEDETEVLNLRAKLYRYDTNEDPPEWKERGTGTVKILQHNTKETVRVVMRRDKTLKLCANHFITPYMELKPNVSCDRAWVYSVSDDYADETARSQLLAIKFATLENARKWKETFDSVKKTAVGGEERDKSSDEEEHEEDAKDKEDEKEPAEVKTEALVHEKLSELKIEGETEKS